MNVARTLGSRLRVVTLGTAIASCAISLSVAVAGVTPWAGTATLVATACDSQVIVSPFASFGDTGDYVFAPNGGLESGSAGWTLAGAASVVTGNEPYAVHGLGDTRSLALGAGSSAISPAVCLGKKYPYSRVFGNGTTGGKLAVDMLYVDDAGALTSRSVGVLTGTGTWALSSNLKAPSNPISKRSQLTVVGPQYTAVAYRFTVVSGTWRIDDLYVDPFKLT